MQASIAAAVLLACALAARLTTRGATDLRRVVPMHFNARCAFLALNAAAAGRRSALNHAQRTHCGVRGGGGQRQVRAAQHLRARSRRRRGTDPAWRVGSITALRRARITVPLAQRSFANASGTPCKICKKCKECKGGRGGSAIQQLGCAHPSYTRGS